MSVLNKREKYIRFIWRFCCFNRDKKWRYLNRRKAIKMRIRNGGSREVYYSRSLRALLPLINGLGCIRCVYARDVTQLLRICHDHVTSHVCNCSYMLRVKLIRLPHDSLTILLRIESRGGKFPVLNIIISCYPLSNVLFNKLAWILELSFCNI